MKFKRILAVILSVLMLSSMASFTVSAEDAELMAEPLLAFTTATNQGKLTQNERAKTSIGYDAENDIIYTRVVPDFDRKSGCDNSIYINMYGLSPAVTANTSNLYFVCYMRSNQSTSNAYAGFYGGLQNKYTGGDGLTYDGSETWVKQLYTLSIKEDAIGSSSTHAWIRPIGSNAVHTTRQDPVLDENGEPTYDDNGKQITTTVVTGNNMAADAYYDIAGVAIFDNEADANAYDIAALSSGKITISFDAGAGTGTFDSYDVAAGKYAASTVVFPTTAPTAPEGMTFNGWAATETGTPFTGDVATPDVDTTYYAQYKYADEEGVDYDDIYLQNVYYKLVNEKNLTIGYLGGSVTVGTGSEPSGTASTTAWRALTTKWFKDNFADAEITEVYAGIGGTGSKFGSYRATRDLKLDNPDVSIDLLFVDSCVNDKYEGFGAADAAELQENDAVIVAKVLENNPYCQVIFVGVPDVGTVAEDASYPTRDAHKAFAEGNGFKFLDFAVPLRAAMAEQNKDFYDFMGVTSTGAPDIVHPNAEGYKVYADYIVEEVLSDLVDETLNISKATYTETEFDTTDIDTMRYVAGAENSNSLQGLASIKNYRLGQGNGFLGGNSISAAKAGYSTTFKFTGTNAYIWANKHSHNALLDVYLNDNVTVGEPDYTIDMWRNQESGQSFMFPVLPADLDEAAETTVTLVLRQNADQETRDAAGHKANVGDRLSNTINNIAIKGGTVDSIEFMASPAEFLTTVEYPDIVVPASGLNLKIDQTEMVFEAVEYDGKNVTKTTYGGTDANATFAIDGYHIGNYGAVLGEYYNYATIYMYVDDPEYKTQGLKPEILLRESDDFEYGNNTYASDVEITPNAWQRISIDISDMENDNPNPYDDVDQFHFRYFGTTKKATYFDGVTIYAEKLVFSAEDPGDWADLDAKITAINADGELIDGFNINTYEYTLELPFGTTEVPTITATTNIEGLEATVVQAGSFDEAATVTLEGETDADDLVYTINFEVFDGIRLNGIKAGDKSVDLKDGVTEYTVTLATGTTEVPEITAEFEGDPAKIAVTQAASLDEAATVVLTDGDAVTTYTISFYVIPSMEECYPDAKIVYVSQNGSGAMDGTSLDNAYAGLFAAYDAEKANTTTTVFALVDDVTIAKDEQKTVPADTIITSAGGNLYTTTQIKFAKGSKANILIENIDIYHSNAASYNAEVVISTYSNNITLNNVNAIPYGEGADGAKRDAPLYVQVGGDGGAHEKTENTSFEVYDTTGGIVMRAGGWWGTSMAGGIDYVVGGASVIKTLYASGHAANGNLGADAKTISGDISVTVADNAKINDVSAGNYAIAGGNVTYNVLGGEVGVLRLGAANSKGNVAGNVFVHVDGGKIGEFAQGTLNTEKARAIAINTDNATVPETISGVTHTVKYSGNGKVEFTAAAGAAESATAKLSSDTAKWAEVTIDGVTTKYDMSTDTEVTLAAEDMTIEVPAGKEVVVYFNEGTGVTFKAYEADGAKADSTETVSGLAGMTVAAPANPEVKNEHFEFVGWALEGTTDIVTDFGAFTDSTVPVVYVAIFKEAPAVQFKATVEAGAVEAMDSTIYGTTGADITAPNAPAAKEHFTFKGWALEGTTDIVTDFGKFSDVKAVYVAVYEEDAKATITVYDGNDKIDEVTDYVGFTYTFKKLDHTPTSRFVGYATVAGAQEATEFAGDEITVNADAAYYAVRTEIKLEDAEYTFEGRYDYSDSKYIVDMYYVGPKANMTAFGIAYDTDVLTNVEVEYSEELQSTGTNKVDNGTTYEDVVYPTEGASFGDDMKTPVYVATFTFDIADYTALDTETAIVKALKAEDITGAYKNDEWQYIKHSEDFSLDIAANVYPIYFTELVDDNAITVTVEGVEADITTVTAPTEGTMLEAIEFTAVTADGEEAGLVSYYVDGVAMGELVAGEDGETYVIPAEKVLGDITIELSYGEPILEVAITGVTAPEAQETPDDSAETESDLYVIDSVDWEPADSEFGFDTAYTVKVTITADEGYAFTGKTDYTINGETATAKRVDKDTVVVSYTFEPTVKELGTVAVDAILVRDEDDTAYANFGKISVLDAEGIEVASYTETEEDAVFTAEFAVLAGTYTVKIEKNGYLTYTEEIEVVYDEVTTVEAELVAGNIYEAGADDGEINLLDFARLTKAFTTETDIENAEELEAYRGIVDIDEDGVVTVFDLAYIKANHGEKAE